MADDNLYAPAFADNNPTGFTNNFLEARSQTHFFDQNYADYKLYEETGRPNTIYRDILKSRVERSPLSDAFFGDANINHLKKLICKQIYQQSGGLYPIDPHAQNTEPMVMVMMSMYLDHAKNLPNDIPGQVAELNILVIHEMVPNVLSKIKEDLSYRSAHSQQPLVINHPVNVSSAGTKSNDLTRTFI